MEFCAIATILLLACGPNVPMDTSWRHLAHDVISLRANQREDCLRYASDNEAYNAKCELAYRKLGEALTPLLRRRDRESTSALLVLSQLYIGEDYNSDIKFALCDRDNAIPEELETYSTAAAELSREFGVKSLPKEDWGALAACLSKPRAERKGCCPAPIPLDPQE